MSRFFGESGSESEDEGDRVQLQQKVIHQEVHDTFQYDSSSEEEEGRIVRSKKEKSFDLMKQTVKTMREHIAKSDWVGISKDFDLLGKQLKKTMLALPGIPVPKFYIKATLKVQEAMKTQNEKIKKDKKNKKKKTLDAASMRDLKKMQQKMNRHVKAYAKHIEAYKLAPLLTEDEKSDTGEESDSGSDDDDDDDDVVVEKKVEKKVETEKEKEKQKTKSKKESSSDSDSDSDSDDKKKSSSSSSSSSSDSSDKSSSDESSSDESSSDESSSDESSSDDDSSGKKKKSGESDDEPQWDNDEDDDVEDAFAEFDIDDGDDAQQGPMFCRDFWVKKEFKKDYQASESKEEQKKKMRKQKEADRVKRKMGKIQEGGTKEKKETKGKAYTEKEILDIIKEMKQGRGKRTTDKKETIEKLKKLSVYAATPYLILKIRTMLTSTLFDRTLNSVTYIPHRNWKECHESVIRLLDLLEKNPNVRLSEDENIKESYEDDEGGYKDMTAEALLENEEQKKKREEEEERKRKEERERREKENKDPQIEYVRGNLFTFVQRLTSESKRALQSINYEAIEYINRLKDQPVLIELLEKTQEYYKEIKKDVFINQIVMLRLGLIYYHYDSKEDPTHNDYEGPDLTKLRTLDKRDFGNNNRDVTQLSAHIYEHGNEKQKVYALLYHTYYLSSHGRYKEARDLWLMSHIQDSIDQTDMPIKILYNRTMAQFGICAFRNGFIEQAHDALIHFYNHARIKELLGQVPRGIVRWNDKRDPKEKALEASRQYPPHMHMNLELLAAIHLFCSMCLEVKNIAIHGWDQRYLISKYYRRQKQNYERQVFNGPPEDINDTVLTIEKKLINGEWEECVRLFKRASVWKMLPNKDGVFVTIEQKLKELSLQTYFIYFGSQYKTVGLNRLMKMFELERKDTYRLCSELVEKNHIQGAWDNVHNCIMMNAKPATKLQLDADTYINKSEIFLEQNERLLGQKYGGGYNRLGNDRRRGWTDFSANKRSYKNNKNFDSRNRTGFSSGFGSRNKSGFGNRAGGFRQW